ncbi:NACHT domain-containing protein [Labedaea rhizosphaerae]|uniref:Transcriptional regulator with XRE-family HTH domain n=1 Tax=Labedaea rhizosphaerae TaxID=598644 RepID=A0A4R6S0R6_LABRH|nr:helix-turn-helix domain-containing protein [Labedaea rhizosphaerae]TDP92794.1 transcriptional regulator with XRE-family HTH domain [Labedaea rhizosphaerae]
MASQFGPLLRRFRLRAGLTQGALADRSGVSERTIRRLETAAGADPRLNTVDALAAALGLDPGERLELLAAAGNQEPPRQAPEGDDRLAEAAGLLAHELRTRLRREEEQRQIHDPVPLPMRWHDGPTELVDAWVNIGRAKPGETVRPLHLDGTLDQIVEVYQRIPSGRLVVLGRAGSGKTILTMRFVLGLLGVNRSGDPVPVIFSAGSWDPRTTPLRDWLTEQLLRDHPGLAAPGPGGTTLAAALVEDGRILPVLDGFDEIAGGLHKAALIALNATTLPLLMTSRVDEYRAAVESTDVLTSAAAVVLDDLTPTDLADYLPRTTGRRGVWEPVLDDVRAHPHGDLAAVLTTPLMVGLARTIYSDTPDHDPADLLDPARFDSAAAIERHLLGSFVPTVYRHRPRRDPHDADRAEHWLGFLAHHLDKLGTRNLAWWQLGNRMPTLLRMFVSGLVLGIAMGVPAALVIGLIYTAGVGTSGSGLSDGFSAVLSAGPMEWLAMSLTVGLAHGASLGFRGTVFEPSRVRVRLRAARRRRSTVLRRFAVGLAVGAGLGAGLGVARELGATFWIVGRLADSLVTTVLFGLALGLVWGGVWGVMAMFEAPVDISSAASPMDLLNTNRRTVAVQSLMFGVVTFLGYTVMATVLHGPRLGLVYGLSYGLLLGLAISLGAASLTAWGAWMVFARVWLPANGRLPWSVPEFLEDAYQRGVLRRSGAVYQFRHARLQDHLTQVYRTRR